MDEQQQTDTRAIQEALAQPFSREHVKCKPGAISGARALVLWFVDARAVMERLDSVLGIENWKDSYTFLDAGAVLCRLAIRLDGEWIVKEDVGGASEQPDAGDRIKAAVSDSLKRAAVHFGVGRFLYSLPLLWAPWDAKARKFAMVPQLPASVVKAA